VLQKTVRLLCSTIVVDMAELAERGADIRVLDDLGANQVDFERRFLKGMYLRLQIAIGDTDKISLLAIPRAKEKS
jgi:hypothetical protein